MVGCTFTRTLVLSALVAAALVRTSAAQEPLPETDPFGEETPELPTGPLDEERAEPEGAVATDPAAEAEDRLEALYAELADPANAAWKQTEQAIWRAWSRSGSASMDLLLRRADEAAGEGDLDTAMSFLDDLVRLAPDFAEGWNKRATVLYMQDQLGRSVANIERTLALEPRHFGALSGLAVILERTGNDAGALRAWRRAAEVHPHLEQAEESIERLEPRVEGRRL